MASVFVIISVNKKDFNYDKVEKNQLKSADVFLSVHQASM